MIKESLYLSMYFIRFFLFSDTLDEFSYNYLVDNGNTYPEFLLPKDRNIKIDRSKEKLTKDEIDRIKKKLTKLGVETRSDMGVLNTFVY